MWVQNVGDRAQGVVRFDAWDPNVDADHDQYSRWSLGANWFWDGFTRLTLSYDAIRTETKTGTRWTDPQDNLWTLQVQHKFWEATMKFVRIATLAALFATLAFAAVAVAGRGITVKGSDTMVILGQRWAEQYMNQNRGQIVQVTGGGSGTGIAALINGTTDICQASRPMKQDEKLKLRDRYQTMGVEIPVAKDGLSVFLNEANPVKDLTLDQLKQIYTGAVTNWKQVGGKDATIILYGRENSSGTYGFFKGPRARRPRLRGELPDAAGHGGRGERRVARPERIGYGGAAYTKGVRDCAVRKDGEVARGDADRRDRARRLVPADALPLLLTCASRRRAT